MLRRLRDWWNQARSPRRARLSDESDATFIPGPGWALEQRERTNYDRESILRQSLEAWRTNPLARRIVDLSAEYVTGGGLAVQAGDPAARRFLDAWWNHPLNRIGLRAPEWCAELARAGELFFVLSTDAGGMSYVRALPASEIDEIETAENDVAQELAYRQRGQAGEPGRRWPAYAPGDDPGEPAMLHYAVNRPPGALRGEPDLAPLLRWLSRYSAWLEDRARLNRYRNVFLFTVKTRFTSEAERLARQQALAAAPPSPGSILVTDENEEWSVLAPRLESHEAGEDGLALKKMIAAGAGVPLHFLAEPESATRTTAEAAGGPAFRRLEQRQMLFCAMLSDLACAALRRRFGPGAPLEGVRVTGADLSARDNVSLAGAFSAASSALARLYELGLIEREEVLRLAYRFSGEPGRAPIGSGFATGKDPV